MTQVKKTINESEAQRLRSWILEMKDQMKKREESIKQKKQRRSELEESVFEYDKIDEEIDELKAEQKEQSKLLSTLIEFSEKASGEEFKDNGPLFEENK